MTAKKTYDSEMTDAENLYASRTTSAKKTYLDVIESAKKAYDAAMAEALWRRDDLKDSAYRTHIAPATEPHVRYKWSTCASINQGEWHAVVYSGVTSTREEAEHVLECRIGPLDELRRESLDGDYRYYRRMESDYDSLVGAIRPVKEAEG